MRHLILALIILTSLYMPCVAQAYTPDEELIYRIHFGRADDIKLLLERGANPNALSVQGEPALFVAMDRGDEETLPMFKALLDKGANANQPDKSGTLPLVAAINRGDTEMVAALMAHGADYHLRNPNGVSIIELARKNDKPQAVKPILEAADKEAAYAASLRTPERFKDIIRQYAFNSCNYQYWSYYLTSRQDPEKNADTEKKIGDSKNILAALLEQIQKYYPETKSIDVQRVSSEAGQTVFDALDAMVSNRNRAEHNVGKDADAKERCQKIAGAINIDFVPADYRR